MLKVPIVNPGDTGLKVSTLGFGTFDELTKISKNHG